MIVSLIKGVDYLHFSLHAEEVITSNYIKDNNEGVYVSSLQFETVDRLKIFIDKSNFSEQFVVFDFRNIEHLQANLFSKFIQIRNLGYKLIFKNLVPGIFDPLSLNIIANLRNVLNRKGGYDTFYYFTDEVESDLVASITEKGIFEFKFENLIKGYVVEYDEKHASSFVYLKSFIDLKKFISNEVELLT
ncbi:hypothetical protein MUK51_07280 [Sphingobacterium faecium]|uniref:hypothetical protein n=1 Tax=Sphingobacterium faecium TaxID=34087 RepID=UPI0021B588C4|nr:hypothetical protein [Sphingobacterium faecium]UXD71087.1 hypothetical protein MUK51_07280 [Sphingobacterium faecium]